MSKRRFSLDSSLDFSKPSVSNKPNDISSSSTTSSSYSFCWPLPTRINTNSFGKKPNKSVTSDDTHISTYDDGEYPSSKTTKRRDLVPWIAE